MAKVFVFYREILVDKRQRTSFFLYITADYTCIHPDTHDNVALRQKSRIPWFFAYM